MPLQIRPATQADAAPLAVLGRVTFAETFGYLFTRHRDDLRTYLDTTFAVGKIRRSLASPRNRYWLALVDQLAVGYAKLKYPSPPPGDPARPAAQLQKIYILQDFLAQHIGRDLLHRVAQEAARHAPTLWLDVLQENTRAIAFYQRQGFRPIGTDTYTIGAQAFQFHLMAQSPLVAKPTP